MHTRSGTEWGMEWNGMKQNETEWNRTKQNETEWNGTKQNELDWNWLKWIEIKHTQTVLLWTERNRAERSGTGGRDWDRIKEKKVFYIITCTNGAERNGMEWNGMKQNETERNRMKQNETEWNGLKWIEMEQIRTNTHGPFRTVPLWTERSGAEREEEIEISIS